MAKEIQINGALVCEKNGCWLEVFSSLYLDMPGNLVAQGTFTIPTTPTALDLNGANPPIWMFAKNTDAVNSIIISLDAAGAQIIATLKPGEFCIVKAATGTPYAKSIGASSNLNIAAIDLNAADGPTCYAPVFTPAAGDYFPQAFAITTATAGASIKYTTDGTTPSPSHGTLYSSPVSIGTSLTLKAIAYKAAFANSPVTSGAFNIFQPEIFTLSFPSPSGQPTATIIRTGLPDRTIAFNNVNLASSSISGNDVIIGYSDLPTPAQQAAMFVSLTSGVLWDNIVDHFDGTVTITDHNIPAYPYSFSGFGVSFSYTEDQVGMQI